MYFIPNERKVCILYEMSAMQMTVIETIFGVYHMFLANRKVPIIPQTFPN